MLDSKVQRRHAKRVANVGVRTGRSEQRRSEAGLGIANGDVVERCTAAGSGVAGVHINARHSKKRGQHAGIGRLALARHKRDESRFAIIAPYISVETGFSKDKVQGISFTRPGALQEINERRVARCIRSVDIEAGRRKKSADCAQVAPPPSSQCGRERSRSTWRILTEILMARAAERIERRAERSKRSDNIPVVTHCSDV